MKEATPGKSCMVPSLADLFFSAILLFLFFHGNSGLLGDGDTGYHIRAGQYIIKTLSVPKQDIFSFHTPPLPWTAHEWLSEVIMALIHDRFGLSGVVAFFASLLALTTALLFAILKARQTNLLLAAAVTIVAFGTSQIHWLARPHVFSFLLMLCWHHVLETWQQDGANRLYLLPLSMLVWVNLHGGYLGGFIVLSAYLFGNLCTRLLGPASERERSGRKVRALLGSTVICLLATLCNPIGYRILLFPFRLVGDSYLMDHVSEFLPPNFHEFIPFKYLLLLLISVIAISRRRIGAVDLALVLIFTNMALYSARYIALFALITAPILTRHSESVPMPADTRPIDFLAHRARLLAETDARSRGHLWSLAALAIVAFAIVTGRAHHGFDPKVKAVAATEFLLRERIPGKMFNDDEFGDYLIYRAYPVYRVFFDGRSDMYGRDRLREYLTVGGANPGWERVIAKYRMSWVFCGSDSYLCQRLCEKGEWVQIYSDSVASIFVKDLPMYRQLIAKYRPTVRLAARP